VHLSHRCAVIVDVIDGQEPMFHFPATRAASTISLDHNPATFSVFAILLLIGSGSLFRRFPVKRIEPVSFLTLRPNSLYVIPVPFLDARIIALLARMPPTARFDIVYREISEDFHLTAFLASSGWLTVFHAVIVPIYNTKSKASLLITLDFTLGLSSNSPRYSTQLTLRGH
jgi:hypothetical protein